VAKMAADRPTGRRITSAAFVASVLAMAACGESPSEKVADQELPLAPDESPTPVPDSTGRLPDTMSYEVAIAIAAANRNRATKECDLRPESERETCVAGVQSDWIEAKSAVDDLRGNQQ
jgi:hypothetical protein